MKRLASLVAVALGGVLFASGASAEPTLRVTARVVLGDAGSTIDLGRPFALQIEARHPPGGIALLPESLDLGARFAERRTARTHRRETNPTEEIDRYQLELIAFEPGEATLPAIPLAFGSTVASTSPLELSVASTFTGDELLVASSTQAEAAPELERLAAAGPAPRDVRVPDYTLLWAGAAAVALVLVVLIFLRATKGRKKAEEAAAPLPPPIPAHELALSRLTALGKGPLVREQRFKDFYTEISQILRAYVGGRYGFESLEFTVDELMDELERRAPRALDRARLRHLLSAADQVKFAKYGASTAEADEALDGSFTLVRQTAPKVEPSAPAGGGS